MKRPEKAAIKIYIPIFTALTLIILSVIAVYTKMDQKDKNIVDSFDIDSKQVYQSVCGESSKEIIESAKNNAIKLNMKISGRSRGSQIREINERAGKTWTRCDEEVIDLIDKAKEASAFSSGTFDITSGKLMGLWSTGIKKFRPSGEDIKEAVAGMDYNFININHDVSRVKLMNKSSRINLECIKDGALCAAMIKTYGEMNADYAIVSVGSTTGVYRLKPESSFWKLSIKDKSIGKNDESGVALIKVTDGYMCTLTRESPDDKVLKSKGSIVVDLRTGYPPLNELSSVTVLHSDAVTANILAYICSVLDKEESSEILKFYKAGAVFIYKDKSVWLTDDIKDNFMMVNKEYELKN